MTDSDDDRPVDSALYEEFLRLFMRDQFRVLAYIRALIYDHTAANDVFQDTGLVLWRSFPTFRPESEFAPWALGIARHQVLKYWRTRDRDRHVFNEALLTELSVEAIGHVGEMKPRQEALEECVKQLSHRQQDLIRRFYDENQSAIAIAEAWNRSVHAVYKALKVMRRSLLECIESRIGENPHYWNFDGAEGVLRDGKASSEADLVFGRNATQVEGIIGNGAVRFDNSADSFVRMEHGTGDKAGTGAMACSSGITIEVMLVSRWSGKFLDYDEIFRKEDGIYRVLLSLQSDGNVGDYARPKVDSGPCLSFGLHIEQEGYSELDMPLDGRDGRPSVANLTDGVPHHIVATYDSFTGKKAIYIDGKLCFEHSFPVGAMILSGGPAQAEIGNHRGFEPFHGVIDEVAFYDFALTPEEVALHYQNVSSGKTYFGIDAESLAVTRWQSVTRVTAGTQRVFNKITGLPFDVAATTVQDPL